MTDTDGNFEILDGYDTDILAVTAHGRITREDYEEVLIPKFEDMVRREGMVKLLLVFGDDFTGYSPGAAWDDAKFGFLHLGEIAGLAVVSDVDWLRFGVKTFSPLIGCPVALFYNSELDRARDWISRWKHAQPGGPEVDATARVSALEDKA